MKKLLLFISIVILISQAIIVYANASFYMPSDYWQIPYELNESAAINHYNIENIGQWEVTLEQQKYPTKKIAKLYAKGKQIEIQIYKASQTITEMTHQLPVSITLQITPYKMFFTTKNIHPRDNIAVVVLTKYVAAKNPQQKLRTKTYKYHLAINCNTVQLYPTCFLIPRNSWQQKVLLKKFKQYQYFSVQMYDEILQANITFNLSLAHFPYIAGLMEDTYKRIQDFSKHFITNKHIIDKISLEK